MRYLELAIRTATLAHAGQFDKGGKPYILHPLHIMNQVMYDTELAQIAVLHDVIEDSNIALFDLKFLGFSKRVIEALDLLTHKKEDSYDEYINRICTNYDAIRVKRKDLEHNSDTIRLRDVTEEDIKRRAKYQRAFVTLGVTERRFQDAKI